MEHSTLQFVLPGWSQEDPVLTATTTTAAGDPIATEEQVGDFVHAWKINDPNGAWGEVFECIENGHSALAVTVSDSHDPDDWAYYPAVADGLFNLAGWSLAPAPSSSVEG